MTVDLIIAVFMLVFVVVCALFYFKNIFSLVTELRNSDYSVTSVLRIAGIFFPILGIIMGAV
jgi:hypothetical protein